MTLHSTFLACVLSLRYPCNILQPTQKDLENESQHRTSSSSMFFIQLPSFFSDEILLHVPLSHRKSWSKLWGLLQGELRFGLNRPNQGRHLHSSVLMGMEEQWSRRWSCIVKRGWPPWPSFQGNCKHGRCNHSQASKKSWVESFSSFNWSCNGLAEVCYWAVCLTFVFPRASAVFKKKCPDFPFTNA